MYHTFLAFACSIVLWQLPAAASLQSESDTHEQLQRQFENLHRSLQNKGGIATADAPVIERLRERFAAFVLQNPDHREAIAGELQLSAWLEDHDRVDTLFQRLLSLDPSQLAIGTAWANYFSRLEREDRVDAIYDELLRISPDAKEIRLNRARRLKQQNNFPRALDILNDMSPADAEDPEVILLRSDCLFAEHRFEEALAVLREIPEEMLQERPQVRRQVEQQLPVREEYVQLWENERAIRDAEATANLPRAEIVTARGTVLVELFEDNAPNTVANFITLAESNFYDETTFHRVIANFMAQGGDPNTKPDGTGSPGSGGPGYAIADEWQREGARKHFAGTLAMANSGPNSAGSQFYITHQPVSHLNEGYTVFGRVLEGLDVVRAIQRDDRIETVRIVRKRDHDYEVTPFAAASQPPAQPTIPDDIPDDLREQVQQLLDEANQSAPE